MFELFPCVNFNRIQQGYSKLKTSLEFYSLENRGQSKLSHSKYFKMHHVFRQVMQKGLNSKQALLFAALKQRLKRKSLASRGKLHGCLYFAWTAI